MISEDGRACLTDVGLTRVAGDLNSNTATTSTSTTEGGCTARWPAPEVLDPERFGLKRVGPTMKSDIYSMAMTIYEVRFLRPIPGLGVEIVLGFDRQSTILRA
jgi:hypothetical protein